MSEAIIAYWPWVLPPFLGALIGYVTNSIAIKMLFRPLREIRVAGLRVPFTPGIIPKQRHELAQSIGRMVSNQLLTEDVLRAQLRAPRFQDGIRNTVGQVTRRVLDGEETSPAPAEPVPGEGDETELERIVVPLLAALLRSPSTHHATATLVSNAAGALGGRRIAELIDAPSRAHLAQGLVRVLTSPQVRAQVAEAVQRWLKGELESDRTISERIPGRFWVELYRALDGMYEPVLQELLRFLGRPDIRQELSVRGKLLLQDILDKLNLLQRLLISAGQYDRSLTENMPQIIDDLIETLEEAARNRSNRDKVLAAIVQAAQSFAERTPEDALQMLQLDPETAQTRVLALLEDWLSRDALVEGLEGFVKRQLDEAGIPEINPDSASESYQRLQEAVASGLAAWLNQGDTAERVAREAIRTLRLLVKGRPTTDERPGIAHWRQELAADKEALDRFLSERIVGLLDTRFPDLLQAVDFEQLVVDKINGLDVERVERLLLMVIAKHLKWINLFGALLGALIGLTQVVLNLLV